MRTNESHTCAAAAAAGLLCEFESAAVAGCVYGGQSQKKFKRNEHRRWLQSTLLIKTQQSKLRHEKSIKRQAKARDSIVRKADQLCARDNAYLSGRLALRCREGCSLRSTQHPIDAHTLSAASLSLPCFLPFSVSITRSLPLSASLCLCLSTLFEPVLQQAAQQQQQRRRQQRPVQV